MIICEQCEHYYVCADKQANNGCLGKCPNFKKEQYERPQGDIISREALKKALHNFFDGKVIDEPAYILRDVFCHIDNAPTVPLPDFKEGYKQAIIDGKTNYSDRYEEGYSQGYIDGKDEEDGK